MVWIELLKQQHFSEHPSLSADVFRLMAGAVGVRRGSAQKLLNDEAVCAAIDNALAK